MTDPELIPFLHGALRARYGGSCYRNLQVLSALLKKYTISTSGLHFLLKCLHFHVFPSFISRTLKFARTGHVGRHLERLSERLPARMLRATIRDSRARLASIQTDLDAVWCNLYQQITDTCLWNALVGHKDHLCENLLFASNKHLQKKFTGLFARVPNHAYCEQGTAPESLPIGHPFRDRIKNL